MSQETRDFDNIVNEAKCLFHNGDKDKASALLLKALSLTEKPRRATGAEFTYSQG